MTITGRKLGGMPNMQDLYKWKGNGARTGAVSKRNSRKQKKIVDAVKIRVG